MVDLEEKLRSGLDFGRSLLSVQYLGFSGYGYGSSSFSIDDQLSSSYNMMATTRVGHF